MTASPTSIECISRRDRERQLSSTYGLNADDVDTVRRAADYLEGRVRMRRIHPTVVQIIYPNPFEASDPPARFGPVRPPLDIAELRRLAAQG